MRRMDYPIAKAKELNINDEEWFESEDQFYIYLKKRLPNGVYRLTGTSNLSKDDNRVMNLFRKNQEKWYKVLFVIASPLYSIENIASNEDDMFADGLLNGKPYFVIKGGSSLSHNESLYLIVKDDIVFLTGQTEF